MKQLLEEYKKAKINLESVESKHDMIKDKLSDQILEVIKIMHNIEYQEIKKFDSDKTKEQLHLNLFPNWNGNPNLIDLNSISINSDILKVRYGFRMSYSCGDDESWFSIKVPIRYFSLSYSELKEIHQQFAISRINRIYDEKLIKRDVERKKRESESKENELKLYTKLKNKYEV